MPRSPEQNQIVKDRRKAKLLDNALKVFAIKGYSNTSIDSITKAARCSHGLFYHYFDSKEEVFDALWDVLVEKEDIVPPIEAALSLGGTKGLVLLTSSYNKFAGAETKTLYAGSIAIRAHLSDELLEPTKSKAAKYDVIKPLEKLIAQAQEEGNAIAGNPKEIAEAIGKIFDSELRNACLPRSDKKFTSGDVMLGLMMKKPLDEIQGY